jgi:hypothetical protein
MLVMQNREFKFTIWEPPVQPASLTTAAPEPVATLPMRSAIFLFRYMGRSGAQGHGMMHIGNGSITGLDTSGGLYDGAYIESSGRVRGTCTIRVPEGGQLVTGHQIAADQIVSIPFDWSVGFAAGEPQELSIAGVTVLVKFEKLRDL